MNQAYIFIGTNIDRDRNYIEALFRLKKLGRILRVSAVYRTAPVGGSGEDFYNGAVLLETDRSAVELKRDLRALEAQMGRQRTGDPNAPRTIDLDLVLYNQDHIDDGQMKIPDPLILVRPFLAHALAELTPDYIHPTDGETLVEIARRLGVDAEGMWLEPAMTAQVRTSADKFHTGERTHA